MDPKHAELLVEVCIELPLVIFSIAILCCVVTKVRSGAATFASDFFLLYIVQAVIDLADYFAHLTIFRLTRYGLLPFLCVFPRVNILHNVHIFLVYMQRIMHALIAHNRFTALSSASLVTESHLRKNGRTIRNVATCAIAMLLATFPGFMVRMEYVPSATPPMMKMAVSETWPGMVFMSVAAVITVFTMFACAYCDVRAVLAYKALSKYRRTKARDDGCLLVFALLQSLIHLMTTTSNVTMVIATFTGNVGLSQTVQNYYTLLNDAYTFSAPIFLFVTSNHVRKSLFSCVSRKASIVPGDRMPPN